jgi:hypothetical protein
MGGAMTRDEMADIAKESGYPIFVMRNEIVIPPYIQKLMTLAYEKGQRDKEQELTKTPSHG